MSQLEKEIEDKLKAKVRESGGECLKWVSPGWAGVPDRIVLLPGGRIIFVETKRPQRGKATELQRWWASHLRSLGFNHWFIHNEADLGYFVQCELDARYWDTLEVME